MTKPPASGLATLLETHSPELRRFLAARCGDADLAEDLFQELWIKATARGDGEGTNGPIANGRAYLFRMANNLVLDHVRGTRRAMARDRLWIADGESDFPAIEERPDPALPADEALAAKQEIAALQKAIDTLPPGARRALRLHRIEGHSQSQVAEIMGISLSGVEKHLAVAMKHLRKILVDCGLGNSVASQTRTAKGGGITPVEPAR